MATIANRRFRLNPSRTRKRCRDDLPRWYLLSDVSRLEDPSTVLHNLPWGGGVIVRHTDPVLREEIARKTLIRARRLGLKVLIAGAPRLAARLNADGVHLSEHQARRGPPRIRKPHWLITAAAHDRRALWRAGRANADAILLSPVYPTSSHPRANALGLLRFLRLAHTTSCPVVALGGIGRQHLNALTTTPIEGVAAIGLWAD